MKIAYITHVFPRLYNTFVQNEIIELIKLGHEIKIFSIYRTTEKIVNQAAHDYQLIDKTEYIEDFYKAAEKNTTTIPKKILKKFSGEERVINQYARYFGNHKIVSGFIKVASIIEKENFDIIHAAFGNEPATAALALSILSKVPFTIALHAYDLFVDFPMAEEKIKNARKIITISEYNKNYLIKKYRCGADKIIIKRVAIDVAGCEKFLKSTKKENMIVSVARLHPIKGIEFGIRALKELDDQIKGLRYVIIGDGELMHPLKDLAEQLGLGSAVKFTGLLPNREALKYLSEATVCILPSIIAPNGDRDGIPTSLIEAMYLSTPVIGSRLSGIPELIDHGENGFLVEPGDVDGLTDGMRIILFDRNIRTKFGESGHKKIEQEFNILNNTLKLVDAWKP